MSLYETGREDGEQADEFAAFIGASRCGLHISRMVFASWWKTSRGQGVVMVPDLRQPTRDDARSRPQEACAATS